LNEWCQKNSIPSAIADKNNKLSVNLSSFSIAYSFPGAHRTSNMIDRLMQRMDRFLVSIKWFNGEVSSPNLSIRAWALIQNFAPFNPYTVSKNDGIKSPAEKLRKLCNLNLNLNLNLNHLALRLRCGTASRATALRTATPCRAESPSV